MEVDVDGRGVWGISLASIAGSGCPSLSRGGLGRKGSSNGSGYRRHPPSRLW
jgi:hypothetical protein